MKRSLPALLLALALLITPALADDGAKDLFPAANNYADAGYTDVAADDWFADAARVCYETGLMTGTDRGFDPKKVMQVSEAAAIAARIRAALTGEPVVQGTPRPGETVPWYQWYVDYLAAAGVEVPTPTEYATRQQLFALLSAVVPRSQLPAINAITALPDTADPGVLDFYNAGILTGTDSYGTFNGGGTLTRAECAAMVARLVRPALRKRFTPAPKPADPGYQDELNSTMALSVNGRTVTLSQFVGWLDRVIYNADRNLYAQTGKRLDWNTDYGVGDLPTYFLTAAQNQVVSYLLMEAQAAVYRCTVDGLAAALTPDPGRTVLSAYADAMGYLSAKHILVADQATAQVVLEALNAQPTMEQFDALLAVYGTDPGMKSNPDGYLFTTGEMVAPFEAGTLALDYGAYSAQPVQTSYGYHIIWRLDPADHPGLLAKYQQKVLDQSLQVWMASATVTVNEAMMDQLDVPGCYAAYLKSLQG